MNEYSPQTLYYRILGPDTAKPGNFPVILIHGLMGFAANWGKIWPELQKNHPVLVFDQRGHGKSPKPYSGYSPDDYASDLANLVEKIGWGKCHIVGHSMGGRVALRFAVKYPQYAHTLTLEDSGMASNPKRVQWIKNLLGNIPTPFSNREDAKKFFDENFRDDPMTGTFLHANLETKENGNLDWRFHAPGMIETVVEGRAEDALEEFASLKIPTLVIRGEKSREFPQEEAELMMKKNSLAKLAIVVGAHHYVHAEKPVGFLQELTRFLADHEHH